MDVCEHIGSVKDFSVIERTEPYHILHPPPKQSYHLRRERPAPVIIGCTLGGGCLSVLILLYSQTLVHCIFPRQLIITGSGFLSLSSPWDFTTISTPCPKPPGHSFSAKGDARLYSNPRTQLNLFGTHLHIHGCVVGVCRVSEKMDPSPIF